MSQTTKAIETTIQHHARIVVELTVNDNVVMEYYTNGQRTRTTLTRGQEFWEILDELKKQRNRHSDEASRKIKRDELRAAKRHRDVWVTSANRPGQGIQFATNVIKGEIPNGYTKAYGEYFTPEKTKKEQKPKPDIKALLDLL